MSAAATAAGFLFASGRLRPSKPERSHVLPQAGQVMRLCSICRHRIPRESHELHMLIAHKVLIAPKAR